MDKVILLDDGSVVFLIENDEADWFFPEMESVRLDEEEVEAVIHGYADDI